MEMQAVIGVLTELNPNRRTISQNALAEDVVTGEPVSGMRSLITGKIQGNSLIWGAIWVMAPTIQ